MNSIYSYGIKKSSVNFNLVLVFRNFQNFRHFYPRRKSKTRQIIGQFNKKTY